MAASHLPISIRITLWSAILAVLALSIAAVGTGLVLRKELIEDVDEQLGLEANKFFQSLQAHEPGFDWGKVGEIKAWLPASDPPRTVRITSRNGAVLYEDPGIATKAGVPAPRKRGLRGRTFLNHGITLYLGSSLEEVEEVMTLLVTAFLCTLPLVLGIVGIGGWLLMRRALRPLNTLAEAAEEITAERLDHRLPLPEADDEIHRLGRVLNETLKRLEASFRQAIRFSADASHELKTPLTILRSGIEDLLRRPGAPPGHVEGLSALLEQTTRLHAITESLLLLSRADAGKLSLDLQSSDVVEIVEACVEDCGIMAAPLGVEVSLDAPAKAVGEVDPARLNQILLNLLSNALRYNHAGGTVKVSIETTEMILVRISNTGPGIPAAQAERLFERFSRGGESVGHGLGLSIARELARAHGGDLALELNGPKSTVFCLKVPLARANGTSETP